MKPTPNPLEQEIARQEQFKRKTLTPFGPSYLMKYYWVFGYTPVDQTKVIWGPYYDKADAARDSTKLDQGEVFDLNTRDVTRATREIKAELLKRGDSPDDAVQRVSHKGK